MYSCRNELFPAANDDQWTLIKKVINDCDYYIVMIAGRYGSGGLEGISYTEMEYRYALEQGIPTIGFIHKDPSKIAHGRSESDPEKQIKLKEFCELVKKKVCRYWDSPSDLGSKVSRSLINLISDVPAVGWVRADQINEADPAEMLRLRHRIEELEAGIDAARETAPPGAELLAQGDELFEIHFTVVAVEPRTGGPFEFSEPQKKVYNDKFKASWNDIFSAVAPLMIDEAPDHTVKRGLNNLICDRNIERLGENSVFKGYNISEVEIKDRRFPNNKSSTPCAWIDHQKSTAA